MKTKYIIPNEIIEDFRKSIDEAINVYTMIKEDVETRNQKLDGNLFSTMKLPVNSYLDERDIQNMALVALNGFIRNLKELKEKVKHINTRRVECSRLFLLLGFIELRNPLSNAIVIKIMKDTVTGKGLDSTRILQNLDIFNDSLDFQNLFCGLLDGYHIPSNNLGMINTAYLGIINNASCLAKIMANGLISSQLLKDAVLILANRIGLSNVDSWDDFYDFYNAKYRKELTKVIEEPKEYKKGTKQMYTEIDELGLYIKGGVVRRLCAPRTFDELLRRNNYGVNARMSLGRQMKNAIAMASEKEANDLVGTYLASIDIRYQEMWEYLLEKNKELKQISLGDIWKYFNAIPEIGDGYGYTKDDFDYFMIDSLKNNYYLAKKQSKALKLIRSGKINENFEKYGQKFKKIS